jgi:hypothetical protein
MATYFYFASHVYRHLLSTHSTSVAKGFVGLNVFEMKLHASIDPTLR